MYMELTQNGYKMLVNMNNVLFIEPSALGSSVHIGEHTLVVDDDYEKIRDLLKHQGGIVSPVPVRLTK